MSKGRRSSGEQSASDSDEENRCVCLPREYSTEKYKVCNFIL